MSPSDNQKLNDLLLAVADGYAQCLDGIYELAAGRMFAVAYGVVREKSAAEDVVHDSLIKIACHANKYRRDSNPSGWILRVVRNTALDYLRYDRAHRAVSADELFTLTSLDYSPEKREDALELERALTSLDDDEKRAIYCRYYLDLTVRETAKELKLSKSAAERLVKRAEQKIKLALSGTNGGDDTL